MARLGLCAALGDLPEVLSVSPAVPASIARSTPAQNEDQPFYFVRSVSPMSVAMRAVAPQHSPSWNLTQRAVHIDCRARFRVQAFFKGREAAIRGAAAEIGAPRIVLLLSDGAEHVRKNENANRECQHPAHGQSSTLPVPGLYSWHYFVSVRPPTDSPARRAAPE
jgi:hypothetical protein